MFTYHEFIKHLTQVKPQIVEAYKENVEPLGQKTRKCIDHESYYASHLEERWYTELVKPFRSCDILTSSMERSQMFDWNFLTQLAASSLSTHVELEFIKGKVDLIITVKTDQVEISRPLSEITNYQTFVLFNIFCEENIAIMSLYAGYKEERDSIIAAKIAKLNHWNNQLEQLNIAMSNYSKIA